jgi:hypothetical protein
MVFGFLNLNPIEILFLGGLCIAAVMVPIVVLVVLQATKKRGQSQNGYSRREAFLQDENERLRDELDRLKNEGPTGETPPGGDRGITDTSPRQFE